MDPRHFKRPESVMVVVHTSDEVLLIKRADHECFWQSVTGSIEHGEQSAQTAVRELFEETGINGRTLRETGIRRSYDILPQWRHKFPPGVTRNAENLFFCPLDQRVDIVLDKREHTDYEWVDFSKGIEKAWSWTNKLAIMQLR